MCVLPGVQGRGLLSPGLLSWRLATPSSPSLSSDDEGGLIDTLLYCVLYMPWGGGGVPEAVAVDPAVDPFPVLDEEEKKLAGVCSCFPECRDVESSLEFKLI